MEVALSNCCDKKENLLNMVKSDGLDTADGDDVDGKSTAAALLDDGSELKKTINIEPTQVDATKVTESTISVTANGELQSNGFNQDCSQKLSQPLQEDAAESVEVVDSLEVEGNGVHDNSVSAECGLLVQVEKESCVVPKERESSVVGVQSECEVVEVRKKAANADCDLVCKGDDEEEEEEEEEQTIIITETKSLAKAINDAVKTPDGKPTLVIIETKTSSNTTATTTTTTSTESNKAAGTTTEVKSSNSEATSKGHSKPATDNKPRPSILQGTLLAPPRVTLKSDAGPSVPLPEDAEVSVDVPSLVVPYLFECQARETLTQFLKKLGPLEPKSPSKAIPAAPLSASGTASLALDDTIDSVARGKTYFDTTLGKFFVDIGLAQVQEWVQVEILKGQRRKLAKGWKTKERERMVVDLQAALKDAKEKNSQFQFVLKKCTRCSYQSESQTVLDKHMETVHVVGSQMQCCFCNYETNVPSSIYNHLYASHHVFARLEKINNLHMCPFCPFEDTNKSRVTRHIWKCQKAFVPEKNLAPSSDYEPPAKRTRLVASVAALKAMSGAVARSVTTQSTVQQQQQASRAPPPIRPKPGELRITPSYVQSVLRSTYLGSTSQPVRTVSQVVPSLVRSTAPVGQRISSGTILLPRHHLPSQLMPQSQLYQVVQSAGGGVMPVVRGSFHSPRFTILPTPPATVTTRGPTPVALIPNLASSATSAGGGSSTSFSSQVRVSVSKSAASTTAVSLASTLLGGQQNRSATTSTASSTSTTTTTTTTSTSKPNISITPVSKAWSSSSRSSSSPTAARAAAVAAGGGATSNNPSYVVCEICDGYIKDLDQLRNHMQWIHKVKIHPKMIHNRPPLNCQKCHYRFFTDQGLERHLLGSHGLVTSSMQENANKGKDGGRCIICGKVFLWKLVVHMAKDHKMTLKPAHLSYKCTVCSATFNMYRLFETHVYEEHSTVAKRVLDTPKNSGGGSSVSGTGGAGLPATKQLSSSKASDDAPMRSCVECGIKFKCTSNCIQHLKESHVKQCHIKLYRVDKCDSCSSKKQDSELVGSKKSVGESVPKRKETKAVADSVGDKLAEQSNCVRDGESQEEDAGDDVFDMEVETIDEHLSSGSVHTDVESD